MAITLPKQRFEYFCTYCHNNDFDLHCTNCGPWMTHPRSNFWVKTIYILDRYTGMIYSDFRIDQNGNIEEGSIAIGKWDRDRNRLNYFE